MSSSTAPAESVGRHIRWQVLLALAGILILTTLLGYSAINTPTVLVPAQGGTFREGVAGMPRYINPLRCDENDADADLCALLFRGLTRTDKSGRALPDLAESWTISEDGLNYDFVMRSGQYWDDGNPVTVDDVLFTIGILQDPDVYSLPALSSLWQAVQVAKVNDNTVRFTLSEPFAPFLDYTSLGLLPKHVHENSAPVDVATKMNPSPIGAGPMKILEQASDHITLIPNPFYAGKSPYLENLELRFYPDQHSLFPAYVAGEIDGVSRILPESLKDAENTSGLTLFSSAQPQYINVTLNLDNANVPFFQEKSVRQALMYGMDRAQIIADIADGQALLADSIILPESWAYNPTLRQYPFDPDTARTLLDSAGWTDSDGDGIRDKDGVPLQFVLHTSDDPLRTAIIERIAADWAQIGVRAVPTAVSFATLVNDLLSPRTYEAVLIGWDTPGDPDPYPLWHSTQTEGAGQNYAGWSNERADRIMEQVRAERADSSRRALYWEFQEIFAEEMPALLLYHPIYTYGVSDRVFNVQVGALNNPAQRFESFDDWYMVTKRVPESQAVELALPAPPSASPAITATTTLTP